ncbi:hypothetical protein JIN85_12210 [Luteolibacter pohnpeiensis]|uniref:Uncharacterized protein n=1 Tax=Luteolibacter pohnpeiensis TaxID=454153 RepID=A0A934S7B9_9BACT|nr:hypothetical protein [Luteolibacter pohnpeiensis]MBK1883183.1 hypothetical protein [Luteolibacter pohnpeiensis]
MKQGFGHYWRVLMSIVLIVSGVAFGLSSSWAAEPAGLNRYVLEALKTMPSGKGYDASQTAVDRLASHVTIQDGVIQEDLKGTKATFCSGATYVVFLRTIEMLRKGGNVTLSTDALQRLADLGVKDGELVFGRWNANGPGTAKLFQELKCGRNFTDYTQAQPGDFMKIWWTDEIGGKERGHSVVFLGQDQTSVRFWSANQPEGYGVKVVPKETIRRKLFSRFENLDALKHVTKLSAKNGFLADMLHQSFTWEQVVKECSVKE